MVSAGSDAAVLHGPVAEATDHAAAVWQRDGTGWTLALRGDWRGHRAAVPPPPGPVVGRVRVDARGLRGWDTRLASALWRRLAPLNRDGAEVDLGGLPDGLRQVIELSLTAAPPAAEAPSTGPRWPAWVEEAGRRSIAWGQDARLTLQVVGETLLGLARLLRGRTAMRGADLAWQLDQTGPRSVPIVSVVALMVGLIFAYMGAAQLARLGAKSFIAELMALAVVREVAALVVGVILAGRVGAAFAAQLGSMRANDEIDALRTLGVDPVEHLVLPRVLAMLIVSPLLTVVAAIVGLATGWAAAVLIYGVSPEEYVSRTVQALSLPHVGVGLLKGTVYGLLVGLAGCRQGLHAGRSAQAVGDATTQAVVKSIVWVVIAASVLTVIFQRFDI